MRSYFCGRAFRCRAGNRVDPKRRNIRWISNGENRDASEMEMLRCGNRCDLTEFSQWPTLTKSKWWKSEHSSTKPPQWPVKCFQLNDPADDCNRRTRRLEPSIRDGPCESICTAVGDETFCIKEFKKMVFIHMNGYINTCECNKRRIPELE